MASSSSRKATRLDLSAASPSFAEELARLKRRIERNGDGRERRGWMGEAP